MSTINQNSSSNSKIKDVFNKIINILKLNKLSVFQIIMLGFILLIIIVIVTIYGLYELLRDKSFGADYSILKLNNQNIPFISLVHNYDGYMCFYAKFLNKYYDSMLTIDKHSNSDNKKVGIKNDFHIVSSDMYNHNFNMWLFIHTSNNSLTNYVADNTYKMSNNTKIIEETFLDFSSVSNKMIFSRGPQNDCWPMIYLNKQYNLCSKFKKGAPEKEHILLKRMPLNKWCNLNIQINNNIISIYINGKLEKSINIDLTEVERLNNTSLKKLYIYSNTTSLEMDGFTGYINNFNYYNKILTPETILNIYKNNKSIFDNLNNVVNIFKNKENKEIFSKINKNITNNYQHISDELFIKKNDNNKF